MHKFKVIKNDPPKGYDPEKPVLYKLYFGDKYFLHKGKKLDDSIERLLDDIFRGMRSGKGDKVFKVNEAYSEVVAHCNRNPSLYKVVCEVVLNADPDKILRKEDSLYRQMKSDPQAFNITSIPPYKPEWMVKQSLQKRCENCITTGFINDKKAKFKFCPNCGRLNK